MKLRALTLIIFISLIGLSSCRKTPKSIGSDLQPGNSLITVSFTDERDIVSSTFAVPWLSTKNVGYNFIGNMNDPVFGNSNFDFYTQMSLSTSSLTWGTNAVPDSVVLNLTYNGYYGDTTDKQLTLRIFEIAEPMYTDSTYKSNMTLQCETEELANITFVPRPLTPVDTTLERGVLRVVIDNSLAEKLIANGPYESNTQFKEAFNGLHLICDRNDIPASVVSFNMTHSYTYLRVYYHSDEDEEQHKYDFTVSSSDVKFNHYTHDFSTVANPITFNDTIDNSLLYVQGAAGARVWLKFPNLQEWANSLDGDVVVNEAKLVLNGAVDDTAMFAPPSRLIITGAKFDTDTTYVLLTDQFVSSEYYGGYYDKTDGTVWFRITEYIQNIIQNKNYSTNTNGLLIYVDQGSLVPHRWAFYGPQSDSLDKRVRLEMVYSLLKD